MEMVLEISQAGSVAISPFGTFCRANSSAECRLLLGVNRTFTRTSRFGGD